MPVTKRMTCPLCEAMCGLQLDIAEDQVTAIRGDPEDPLSRGAICPKAVALRDLHEDPDRLRTPLKKTAHGHEEIGWAQAFDEVTARLADVRKRHGRHALATYFGNPLVHNTGGIVFGLLFTQALNTRNTFSATSLDQLPQMLAAYAMFGHQLMLPVPDLDRTRNLIVLGANPAVSNGSLMSAPGMKGRLRDLRRRGGNVTVIDPRRTETASLADEHHFIRPGTDALLLFAMVHVLLVEGRAHLGRLAGHVRNLDRAQRLAEGFAPETVAEATGVPSAVTRKFVDRLLEPTSTLYARIGICTQAFGGLSAWLVNLVNLLTGNLDHPGGAMFTTPAIDALVVASRLGRTGSFEPASSRVRKLARFGGELPTATLAEEIETEGEERIRGLITAAGNPVLSAPNGRRLQSALRHLDVMVSIDPYLNETTRHADYVLPPVSPLERDHYDLVFHALAVRNTAKFVPAPLSPPPEGKQDWEIFAALTHGLERKSGHAIRAALYRGAGALGPRALLSMGLRLGPYRLSLAKLRDQAQGVDLGPLEPRLPERLFTEDKKVDAAPALYEADVARLKRSQQTPPPELVLIGRRELRSNNSWMHNAPTLTKGPMRCTLRMHPEDARARSLADGATVHIRSRVGALDVPLETSDELMRGVVSLPHGYGHDREGTRLRVAEAHAGVCANDLLDEQLVDELTGNAVFSGQAVEVEPITPLPES